MRWNRMLLKLASCLMSPAGILDSQSPRMALSFRAQGSSRFATYCPPHGFLSFLPISIHKLNSFQFLTVCLSLLSLLLRTWSGFLPVECVKKCEKWFDHHIFGHPSLLFSLLLSSIAPYLTENLHVCIVRKPIYTDKGASIFTTIYKFYDWLMSTYGLQSVK